jgi:hypothetical protein
MFKRPVRLLVVALLVVTTPLSQSANAGRVIDPKTERLGLVLTENMELSSMTSVIYGRTTRSDVDWRICKTITDSVCTAANQIMVIQYFALCAQDSDINCIEEVWARDKAGQRIEGNYVRHLPASGNTDFPGEPAMNLPASKGNSFVMKIPGLTHLGKTDDYLVALRNMTFLEKSAGELASKYKVNVQGLIGAVTPFEIMTGDYRPITVMEGYGSDGGLRIAPNGDTCFASEQGICAAIRGFPSDVRYGMSIRLSEKLIGWFHGRITSPTIATNFDGSSYRVSIEASPVRVASLDFIVPAAGVSQEIKDILFNGEEWGVTGNLQGVKVTTGLDEDRAQTLMQLFTPHFEDKSTRTNEYWTFKTLGDFRNDAVRRCTDGTGDLAGVVSTNALLYSAGPPSYNADEGTLDYRVSSPHYESNGSEAVGTYDLLLRSDLARCIYGFTEAPIKATLEVIASDGTSRVATTSINERDGWLVMSAGGFGFSSPIVRARLTQEEPVPVASPSPSSTPSPTATAESAPQATPTIVKVTKKAITCIKGEKKKRVQAAKPKCPKGWKKA